MARGVVSKFQPCLPEDTEDRLLAERLLDRPGTFRFLAAVNVSGIRVAARPSGMRLAEVETSGPIPLELSLRAPGALAAPRNESPQRPARGAFRKQVEPLKTKGLASSAPISRYRSPLSGIPERLGLDAAQIEAAVGIDVLAFASGG
jgi:hypothetical protein